MKHILILLLCIGFPVLGADRVPRVGIDQDDTVLPHLVAGGQYWTTSITLVNVWNSWTDNPAHFTLRFYDDAGIPWNVPFTGGIGTVNTITSSIPVGGSITYTTAAGGEQKVGWAEISYDWSHAAIAMWGVFKLNGQPVGQPNSEAVVPASKNTDAQFVLPFDNTGGFQLGLGVANPDSIPTTAELVFTSENGAILYETTYTLPGKGHEAFQLLEKFRNHGLENQKGALHVNVTSGKGLAVLGLRFTPYNTFTSVHTVYEFNRPLPQ
jgi:hypothetical protein